MQAYPVPALRFAAFVLLMQVSVAKCSNHAADSCVYRDSCCDIQPWARAAHLYYSA